MQQPPLIAGLFRDEPASGSEAGLRLQDLWQENLGNGYNFTLLNISRDLSGVDPANLTPETYEALPQGAFTRKAHSQLSTSEWHSIGGVITGLPAPGMSNSVAEKLFEEAAQWAKYLGLHSITFNLGLLEMEKDSEQSVLFFGELISRLLHKTLYEGFNIWIKVPWTEAGWDLWNELRGSIGETPKNRIHVVVSLEEQRGKTAVWSDQLSRWFGESIQAVSLPTSQFGTGSNTPELPNNLRYICGHFFAYPNIKWLIEGPCLHGNNFSGYRDHLEHIQRQHQLSDLDLFLLPSTDHLQRPMQPLQDQLQSSSYELFEKDPVKYVQYEQAIRQALIDSHNSSKTVLLMVLGAGRGPLVDAALRAADGLPCTLKIFAIEKNPPAVVTLKHRVNDDWQGRDVTVVEADMREWECVEKADILVSELLGSWGDNELSPECLDGAQHLLKDDSISIPASYTSYLAPITSARLHSAAASLAPFSFPEIDARKFLESTYVVKMGAVYFLSSEEPCFTFSHPNSNNTDNQRHRVCTFTMPESLSRCILHGFRGTFDCTLYGDIHISIADVHYSEGMFCWFPLYVPLETPLTLQGGEEIRVQVWRRVSDSRMWYEWMVEDRTHIHNQGGRSSWMGLN